MNSAQCTQLLDRLCQEPSEALESDTVEFKHYSSEGALHNAKDLAEEISALANHKGGIVLVGVRDSSNVSHGMWGAQLAGFVRVDLHTTRERLRGKLRPSLDLELSEIKHAGKDYLLINIPCRRDSLVATTSGKVCIRDGKSSRPMTPDEIENAVKSLQDYDWSSELLDANPSIALNDTAVEEAFVDFAKRRNLPPIDRAGFLEAIGATHNGVLTKSGLLFLGNAREIARLLAIYEYRFSRKTAAGRLEINDVWQDCLWETIKRGKAHFDACNRIIPLDHEGRQYSIQLLDRIAFHEAYLNALVHRDYSADGMVSVNFTGDRMVITSPGSFYGGVTSDNIAKHEPRHRNKALARMLMEYHLVDRAGMGVLRMSVNSLRYGRAFPSFVERGESVEVVMQGEYFRPGIFVLATDKGANYGIPELLILNSVYETGSVAVLTLIKQLAKATNAPWPAVETAVEKLDCVDLCGTHSGVFVRVKPEWSNLLKITKAFRVTSASPKHVKLYKYLARHGSASNADIKAHLGFTQTSQTSQFLKSASYAKRSGRGPSSIWSLAERE
jgi:predicted HTH transcriptional regulator